MGASPAGGQAVEALDEILLPHRPILLAVLLDLEAQHGLGIDVKHAAGLVLGQVAVESFAVDQKHFGAVALEAELAVLEPLLA